MSINQGTKPIPSIDDWLVQIEHQFPYLKDNQLLRQAVTVTQIADAATRKTPYQQTCLEHGMHIVNVLLQLHLDPESLAAALVYSSSVYADLSLEDIQEQLGKTVSKLVQGTLQMDAFHHSYDRASHAHRITTTIDNLRKMVLAMVDDIRVVLIKLAEQLCLLKAIKNFPAEQKLQLANEVFDIYAPLANRLGIGYLKWQLEDLAFRYRNPEIYQQISKALKLRRADRENYVHTVIAELKQMLQQANIHPVEVSGRVKHIYSLYRKMQHKHVDIAEIYDAVAMRILVPTIENCYAALGAVNAHWQYIEKEFDDYIAHPKANGYRSIHTAVFGPLGPVEIQIRTFQMHEESELGVAAHWMYKENIKLQSTYETKIRWLRQLMSWQKDTSEHIDNSKQTNIDMQTDFSNQPRISKPDQLKEPRDQQAEKMLSQVFADRAYVFTPEGDVVDLPKGATPLDFAYQIHTDLGHRCRGAKINNKIVPLTYKLVTGEKVAILTAKHGQPSRDWLRPQAGFLATTRARSKVHQWFRKYDLSLDHEQRLATAAPIPHPQPLEPSVAKPAPAITLPPTKLKTTEVAGDISIHGVGNLLTHMANCCKPLPGDDIIGYITKGRGISVHRRDCINLLHLASDYNERLVETSWSHKPQQKYPVDLLIVANDQSELIRDITQLFSQEKITLLSINTSVNKMENRAYINLTIEIDGLQPLSKILVRIQQLPDVISVQRRV